MRSTSLPWRQLISPLPYSPPNTNAAFFRLGTTMTHAALFHRSCGTPFSGTAEISVNTVAASSIRRFSAVLTAARSGAIGDGGQRHDDHNSAHGESPKVRSPRNQGHKGHQVFTSKRPSCPVASFGDVRIIS